MKREEVPIELMHGLDYLGHVDLTGWWLSEKFDGCRALWDGRRLISRGGFVVSAPVWWLDGLPQGLALDGEIFCGNGAAGRALASSAVRFGHWHPELRFMVFDQPTGAGNWDDRMRIAEAALSACEAGTAVPWHQAASTDDALGYARDIIARGGEGAVARDPSAPWSAGRSGWVLELKGGLFDR